MASNGADSSSASSSSSSSSSSQPSADVAANEAIIRDLLSPTHEAEHNPVTSATTETILAAADKPQQPQPDSFYSQGLPDLAPQVLSPVGGSPTGADAGNKFFPSKTQ